MNNAETNSKEVARLLERTAARTFKMQTDEIAPAFNEAEATCLTLVLSEELELEVKRRVAEWKMRLLCDRNVPFETAETLHNNIVELGYTNLENEGGMEIFFAQYCERQDQTDHARLILHQLRTKLGSALRTKDLEVYRQFKELSEEILFRIDRSRK